MTIFKNYFDELEFWDTAFFCTPIITKNRIEVEVHNFKVYEEHPLNDQDKPFIVAKGNLIFQGVSKSERFIYEYYIDSQGKQKGKPARKVTDGSFIELKEDVEEFVIEGVLKQPWAWISWDIESVSFELEV